jgi:hypothetical protein
MTLLSGPRLGPYEILTMLGSGGKEYCQVSPFPAKEIADDYTLCGSAIPDGPDADGAAGTPAVRCSTGAPASRGPFKILVPDNTKIIGCLS